MIDLNKTVAELRVIAKEHGVVGYSKMRKADLVAAITEATKVVEEVKEEVVDEPVPPVLNRHQRRRAAKLKRIRENKARLAVAA